jgi:hypothetical protein
MHKHTVLVFPLSSGSVKSSNYNLQLYVELNKMNLSAEVSNWTKITVTVSSYKERAF